jgi:hypothetical protein
LLEDGERVFADKEYIGQRCFIVPCRGRPELLTERPKAFNQLHTKMYWAHIERVNQRLKVWKFFEHRARYSHLKHERAFVAITRIVNIDLLVRPLWATYE